MKEVNFDGLVGPTHNYAGLSYGNIASQENSGSIANPRQAAKQGLQKMRLLMELGVPQAVMPPHQRPNISLLRKLGFSGDTTQILQRAYKENPKLLSAVYSAASMWTANMATVSPSANTEDGKVHFTPANLTYNLHRAQEAEFSYKLLKYIFSDTKYFAVHEPLNAYKDLADEGAANHSTLCKEYGKPGLELFIYGYNSLANNNVMPIKFPARQTRLASTALMQTHSIKNNNAYILQQNPLAIDAGVFHNDVVFVANKNVILMHSLAFQDQKSLEVKIRKFFAGNCHIFVVGDQQMSIHDAVSTYLFNSQLVSLSAEKMALILPLECKSSTVAQNVIQEILAAPNPIQEVYYVECRQSMRNGGGPACLRLRVILTQEELAACKTQLFMTPDLYVKLENWVDRHYRDRLSAEDLLDVSLVTEVEAALDQLTQILNLGSIYPFQQS
jgi:succinylarginine dihydrolase